MDGDALAGHLYEAAREEMLAFVPPTVTSVLDVGCGGGLFGSFLRKRHGEGLRLEGIDPYADSCALARTRGFDRVLEGYYPDALGATDRYDCVVFNDVLEHMPDPWAALERTREHLNPGGVVVASLPSVLYLPVLARVIARRRWDYTEEGTLDRTHLRFFTKKTMVEMFEQAGFSVERAEGINNQWYTGRWGKLQRLAPFTGEFQWLQFAIVARLPNPAP